MQIYVGNLSPEVNEDELRSLFEKHGRVRNVSIGRDKSSGDSEGYGFVEMTVKSEARKAVEVLRGKEIKGRVLRVKILKPDDEFHQHALNLHAAGVHGQKAIPQSPRQRGDIPYRGSGAIRRGGRRGG
jgi:RNA recognition motif-containing protein